MVKSNIPGQTRSRIKAEGELHKDWSDRLRGMEITTVERFELEKPITVLIGCLSDPAAPAGASNLLHNMLFPVTSAENGVPGIRTSIRHKAPSITCVGTNDKDGSIDSKQSKFLSGKRIIE